MTKIYRDYTLDELFEDLSGEGKVLIASKYGDYRELYYDGDIVILKRDNRKTATQRRSDDDCIEFYNEVYNDGDIIVLKRKTFGT